MTAKKKSTTGTGSARKLKFKKETLRDLDVKKGGKAIKGGLTATRRTASCMSPC